MEISWYKYPSHIMRKLYQWVLHWADTGYAVPALFVLAFVESSFFPIPPDVLLLAMGLGKPHRAWFFALICSAGSVLGGMFGYFIGYALWGMVQALFIPHVFSQEVFQAVCDKYELYSFMIVFLAAFTPIPYKVFTIAAGVCHINFPGFVFASMIGRSMRFFIVAAVLYFFGEKTKRIITKHFEVLTIAFGALIVLGFFAIKNFLH